MFEIYSIAENDYHLSVVEMTESLEQLFVALENFEDYSAEFIQLRTDKRRREFLMARILINRILKTQVQIMYDTDGKPFLKNHQGFISISHSKYFLAVLYHSSKPVGIDIECPTERVLKVSNRFLNLKELSYFKNDILKIQLAWSAKEAVYKVAGKPAVDFSSSMCVKDFELADEGFFLCEMLHEQIIYRLHYIVKAEFNLVYTHEGGMRNLE
jgi:phosphopantetheinyl transferase